MSTDSRRADVVPWVAGEFFGREPQLERALALLIENRRLISIVGPGGIGKTRLAAEVFHRYRASATVPIHWVPLARLPVNADGAALAEEVLRVVAGPTGGSGPALAALLDALRTTAVSDRPAILLLDNCEHVLDGVRTLLSGLLGEIYSPIVVVTSREPIGWVDENICAVPSMTPDQAVKLFVQRAALTGNPILPDLEDLGIVAEICRHVDNNPLFVRLAAARLLHRPLAAVLRELTGGDDDRRLLWSHGPRTGADPRHRGVRDVIGWSFRLCTTDERLLLTRLSVFAAGYDPPPGDSSGSGAELEAIIAVCGDDVLAGNDIEHLVERLVERSLLSAHMTRTAVHYFLPESVRLFAGEALRGSGSDVVAKLTHRHRGYYRDAVEGGAAVWAGADLQLWLEWVEPAWDNIITAIETGLDDPDAAPTSLAMTASLTAVWIPLMSAAGREVVRLTERAVRSTRGNDAIDSALRVRACAAAVCIALWQGHDAQAERLIDECVAVQSPWLVGRWYDTADSELGLSASIEWMCGLRLLLAHRDPRAVAVLRRSREKFQDAGDRVGVVRSDMYLTFAAAMVSEPAHALEITEAVLVDVTGSGSEWVVAWSEICRATALAKHGDIGQARTVAAGALRRDTAQRDVWTASWAILAWIQVLRREVATVPPLGELAPIAIDIAWLLGAHRRQLRSIGVDLSRVGLMTEELEGLATAARTTLGAEMYAAISQDTAERADEEDLRRFALGDLVITPTPPPAPSRWPVLSTAEQAIALLVAAGWSNRAIAARRGSSLRTVDAQVSTIRQKLNIRSRAEVFPHVPDTLTEQLLSESEQGPPDLRHHS